MDTGAEIDLTPRRDFFRRLLPLEKPILIRGAFGEPVVARFHGDAYIPVDEGVYLVVPEMVLCESLRDTLLSMVKLIKRGHHVHVDAAKGSGVFIDSSDEFTIPITIKGNIFAFDFQQHEVNVTTRARFRSGIDRQPQQQQVHRKSSWQHPRCQQYPIPRRPFLYLRNSLTIATAISAVANSINSSMLREQTG